MLSDFMISKNQTNRTINAMDGACRYSTLHWTCPGRSLVLFGSVKFVKFLHLP